MALILLVLLTSQAFWNGAEATTHSRDPEVDQREVRGAGFRASKTKRVEAAFHPVEFPSCPTGWATARDAALAFYTHFDDAYLGTNSGKELVGFLLESEDGRFFFTNASEVPDAFELSASITVPRDWRVGDMMHTHPRGHGHQEGFSASDRDAVLKGFTPGYYVRTPLGYVRYLNHHLARRTRTSWGARGISICVGSIF